MTAITRAMVWRPEHPPRTFDSSLLWSTISSMPSCGVLQAYLVYLLLRILPLHAGRTPPRVRLGRGTRSVASVDISAGTSQACPLVSLDPRAA